MGNRILICSSYSNTDHALRVIKEVIDLIEINPTVLGWRTHIGVNLMFFSHELYFLRFLLPYPY